jgi:hypothetical protein
MPRKSNAKSILEITPPKKGAFEIETEEFFPKLHTLTIASGKRGGGKSCAVANYVSACLKKGYFDKVWLISPTYASNKEIWDMVPIHEDNVMEPSKFCMKEISDLVDAERASWDEFLERKKKYDLYLKDMRKNNLDFNNPEVLSRLLDYEDLDFFNDEPRWHYANEVPPRLAVIIDDCVGSDLMRLPSAGLVNTAIKHRHLGNGLGLSMFMLVQSYACKDGVPRPIRENCTHLMLFRISQQAQIKRVYEESDINMSYEEFYNMLREVHEEPHNFLFFDFAPKEEKYRFRRNFTELLIPKTTASDDHTA